MSRDVGFRSLFRLFLLLALVSPFGMAQTDELNSEQLLAGSAVPASIINTKIDHILVRASQAEGLDASYDYFIGLIELALSKVTPLDNRIELKPAMYMSQARALYQLELGEKIDIYWAGTSIEREEKLRAIRVPLLKGLLGFRLGIMRKEVESRFRTIGSAEDFKSFKPCQGRDWPDTNILVAAGFQVVRNPNFKGMFKQVNEGRCDFFPRGVHEAYPEYTASREGYPELRLNEDILLYYPFPMYFFVNKDNQELASLIRTGLDRAIDDGSLEKHMRTSEVTRHLFPLEGWINAKILVLDNPFLPKDTDIHDPRYWVQYKQRGATLIQ